jgi:peptidoglycan-associated lipoprotein
MILKFAVPLAAILFVAACSDQSTTDGGPTGTNQTPGNTTGSGSGITSDALGGNRAAQVAQAQADWQRSFSANGTDRVFFGLDQYTLSADAQNTLRAQAQFLQRYPLVSFVIEGHADERGTREYNLALSDRRAQSAREFLASLGVDGNRLQVISYGKERPSTMGRGDAVWAKNRRAVSVPR